MKALLQVATLALAIVGMFATIEATAYVANVTPWGSVVVCVILMVATVGGFDVLWRRIA